MSHQDTLRTTEKSIFFSVNFIYDRSTICLISVPDKTSVAAACCWSAERGHTSPCASCCNAEVSLQPAMTTGTIGHQFTLYADDASPYMCNLAAQDIRLPEIKPINTNQMRTKTNSSNKWVALHTRCSRHLHASTVSPAKRLP